MTNTVNNWYVYIVECADGTLYTGITKDIERRILEHNYGMRGAKYTRSRRPVKLLVSWDYESRSAASIREYQIKKMSRKQKMVLINEKR
tara:strand:- start:10744 stop:11010 length:267 start_codon:yes stop_codon:yes gene_type:complete